MKYTPPTLRYVLAGTQRLFQRARSGSVLILVIALLVLLALMGTAYISTARTERYSSAQHITNTQADLLLQGVVNSLSSEVVAGTYGTNQSGSALPNTAQFRPPSQEMQYPMVAEGGGVYFNYCGFDGFGSVTAGQLVPATSIAPDLFLADRIPTFTDTATYAATNFQTPVSWAGLSWPLFTDPSGYYVFDSPFENGTAEVPVSTYSATNRSLIRCFPSYKYENGKAYPGLILYAPSGVVTPNGNTGGGYLTPFNSYLLGTGGSGTPTSYTGFQTNPPTAADVQSYVVFAADADGDGIADSPLWKLPVSPIDGITYYAAVRVVDNNAAFNASTAFEIEDDPGSSITLGATTYGSGSTYFTTNGIPNTYLNYGLFRSNVGLYEALNPNPSSPSRTQEMSALNNYRFAAILTAPSSASAPSMNFLAYDDNDTNRTDFRFMSLGDVFDSQLARRGLNPGYADSSLGIMKMGWIGSSGSAAVAYKFCLANPSGSSSLLEELLPNETLPSTGSVTTVVRTSPYSADSIYSNNSPNYWYTDQFAPQNNEITSPYTVYPTQLRSFLVGSNAQSNAIASRFGNTTSIPAFNGNTVYQFGDLVKGSDGYTYVSLCANNNAIIEPLPNSNDPSSATNKLATPNLYNSGTVNPLPMTVGSVSLATTGGASGHYGNDPTLSIGQVSPNIYENPFWARVPWSSVPVKASVNTATFEQLWMAFCHVMTDSVEDYTWTTGAWAATAALQWNPPLAYPGAPNATDTYFPSNKNDRQLGMFRSSVRDNSALPGQGFTLTPMQMMQLRAALAAVNTIDLRDGDNDVTSRHVVLDGPTGAPLYDAEVYGTEKQPYICEVLADVQDNGTVAPTKNFVAIELVNPYPTPIIISTSWKFAYIARTGGVAGAAPNLTLTNIGSLPSNMVIPAASGNLPGFGYITSATSAPTGFNPPIHPAITVNSGTTSAKVSGSNMATLSGLEAALAGELVILKPRLESTPDRLSGANPNKELSSSTDPYDRYDEVNNIADLVPVDQIDFTGALAVSSPPFPYRLHYRRAAAANASPSYSWNFVYPGPYYPTANGTVAGSGASGGTGPGGGGTVPAAGTTPATGDNTYTLREAFQIEPESTGTPSNDVGDFGYAPSGVPTAGGTTTPTFYTAPIQVNNGNMAGVNSTYTSSATTAAYPTAINAFPFGGFARNGDLLQIPFIGAYRIRAYSNPQTAPSAPFIELNSISMDSAYAWDVALAAYNAGVSPGIQVTIGRTQTVQSNPVTLEKELPPEGAAINQPPPGAAGNNQTVVALGSNFFEQIGRFCPVGNCGADGSATSATWQDFNDTVISGNPASYYWHYHWAKKIFEYLTVDAPHDDYFPNVDPRAALATTGMGTANPTYTYTPNIPAPYPPYEANNSDVPEPVANRKAGIANVQVNAATGTVTGTEDTVPVEGLININTAPLAVLSQLPFVPKGFDNIYYLPTANGGSPSAAQGTIGNTSDNNSTPSATTPPTPPTPRDDNVDIAQAIIDYRNVHGPFKSIFDLYKVPAVALENQILWQNAQEPTPLLGYFIGPRPPYSKSGVQDWTTAGSGSDSPRFDFAERFLILNRISNLITTRSDSFTCYVLLQGWRGVGSGAPSLAVQRRAAYILDRSGITPINSSAASFPVPSN